MKRIIYLGMMVSFAALTSCGGESTEGTETDTDTTAVVEEVVETTVTQFTIDTMASTVNWKGYESMDPEDGYHFGTVGIAEGSFEITSEGEMHSVTSGSMTLDMASIQSGEELDKLTGHLQAPDFFNVAEFATSSFTVTGYADGAIEGTLNVLGSEVNISAPSSIDVTEGIATVSVEEFRIDMTPLNMPFFIANAEQPEEEQQDPNIAVNATIVGM
ncbi:MAG: YceI family protein [Crocinitomicaceae bacterium]|nr:YceI family protein [Crocinitomicaceae bacterium]